MKLMFSSVVAVAIAAHAAVASEQSAPWLIGGFEMPESMIYDAARDQVIVSNIVGVPNAVDGVGYLSRLGPDGAVRDAKWVQGFDSPKGMAIVGDQLFVADVHDFHIVDLESGAVTASIAPEGAKFLNDVTSDGAAVYIGDLMTNTIWRYADGALDVWVTDPALSHPNGLLWQDDHLLVGSWGAGLHSDFTTDVPGSLLSVDGATKQITTLVSEVGNIDGLIAIKGGIYLSDWLQGTLMHVTPDGTEVVAQYPMGLADVGVAGSRVLVPLMLSGQVGVLDLN